MERINKLHEEAMNWADQSLLLRRSGNFFDAKKYALRAYQLEAEAARILKDNLTLEPSRSVLYRSAASLAIQCEEYREAEKLIGEGLCGDPPSEISGELRNLLEDINFTYNLRANQINLSEEQIQMSINGNAVGYGQALFDIFFNRIRSLGNLVVRTVERLNDRPFRETGHPEKIIKEKFPLFLGAPVGGSLAITLRIGNQMQFSEKGDAKEVIQEIMECINLVNLEEEEKLHEKIKDVSYYNNFIALAKQLAPDGKNVSTVGLLTQQQSNQGVVVFKRKQKDIAYIKFVKIEDAEEVTLEGDLKFEDDLTVKLVDKNKKNFSIVVPAGIMTDVVTPLFRNAVIVHARKKDDKIYLEDIMSATE